MANKTDIKLKAVNANQQCIADTECYEPLELDLDESVLTKERKQHIQRTEPSHSTGTRDKTFIK